MPPERFLDSLPLRFVVLSSRNPDSDFRRPLVDALRRHYETYYIWLKRRPRVELPAGPPAQDMSFPRFLAFMRHLPPSRDRLTVYFNTTNTDFPYVTSALRLIAPAGLWCLDMHDDLLYESKGLRRLRERLALRLIRLSADLTVHAAPTLTELFPKSHHLGNASDISRLTRAKAAEEGGVLILASLDERFDFALVDQVAALVPDTLFHIHGQVSMDNPAIRERLDALCRARPSVIYHGAYVSADLPGILGRYAVTFAPYRVNSRLTRYIDPLRYYHCLNSGLEVITTAIPQAAAFGAAVHTVATAQETAALIDGLRQGRVPQRNLPGNYQPVTWEQKYRRLLEIVADSPDFKAWASAPRPREARSIGPETTGRDPSAPG